jgi:hypothetical protein
VWSHHVEDRMCVSVCMCGDEVSLLFGRFLDDVMLSRLNSGIYAKLGIGIVLISWWYWFAGYG